MIFHNFGDEKYPKMILIHGVLTPWQIWQEHIKAFSREFMVIVPALDAHTEEENSEFFSIEQEAEQIENYISDNYGTDVFMICGLSMGGAIANTIFGNGKLKTEHLILDGAPLMPMNTAIVKFMINQYLTIIHKSKERDPKTLKSFKKDFLPEKYLDSFLKIADRMTDSSIVNMINSVGGSKLAVRENTENTKILFMHGTTGNEALSKRSAALMKKNYPDTEIKCFKGSKHAEIACFTPDKHIETIKEFITEK